MLDAPSPLAAAPTTVRVPLSAGELTLTLVRQDWLLESLCDFAVRRNAKRGFLVVSKVLGRHLPARPSAMRAAAGDLASRIDGDLPGPVLILGLAETAVCLGQSVHEAYLARTGRRDVAFLHSTRQLVDGAELLARFQEPHSHAPAHLIYRPIDPAVRDAVLGARSLVLVDDEASTGTTFVNLAAALGEALPRLAHVRTAVLADWSGGDYLQRLLRGSEAHSLLEGRLSWSPSDAPPPAGEPAPTVAAGFGRAPAGSNFGRFGRLDVASNGDVLANALPSAPGRRVLVLGSGEFTYPAFRVAEILERRGCDVVVQATTRSPVRIGGAVACALDLTDDYGSGAPHFLYNQRLEPGRDVYIGHETAPGSVDPALLAALNATPLAFGAAA